MRIRRSILLAIVATTAGGCLPDELPTNPLIEAFIQVTVTTTGLDHDADGYSVFLDRIRRQPVGVNDRITLRVTFGTHSVALDGIADNCTLLGDNPRTVSVGAEDTVAVAFAATCNAQGSVRVTVVTTGIDPDPDGYSVRVRDAGQYWKHFVDSPLPANGSMTVRGLTSPREYVLRLRGVAANCDVAGVNSQTVNITGGDTIAVAFDIACTPVTQLLYVRGEEPAIYVINSNGTNPIRLAAFAEDPAWSPDGTSIAYTSRRNGNREIYVMHADGSSPRRLTAGPADYQPAWSPDGRKIVFASGADQLTELYVMNADGTDAVRLTTNLANDTEPAWSPDGTRIAFTSDREGKRFIYVMHADGSEVVKVSNSVTTADESPAWSPDGTRLAFTRHLCPITSGCGQEIYVANANGTGARVVGEGGMQPAWSSDGRHIAYTGVLCDFYYYSTYCDTNGIRIVYAAGGDAVEVTTLPDDSRPVWRP